MQKSRHALQPAHWYCIRYERRVRKLQLANTFCCQEHCTMDSSLQPAALNQLRQPGCYAAMLCCHAACQLSKWVASSSTHTNQTFNRLCSMVGQLVGAPAAPHACSVRKAASHQQGMCTGHVEKRVPCTLLAACTRQPARLTSQEENPRFHQGNTKACASQDCTNTISWCLIVPDSARLKLRKLYTTWMLNSKDIIPHSFFCWETLWG